MARIKQIIKKIIPHEMLELYRAGKYKKIINDAKKYHQASFSYKKKSGDIIIVFMVYQPQSWNSLKTVYEAAVAHPEVVPYVIVIGGESRMSDNNSLSALEYFTGVCSNVIDCTSNNEVFDLNRLSPDFVFRQTLYDSSYPEKYSLKELSKISKICYVPYNYNFSPLKHLKIEYDIGSLANVYAVFSESDSNARYCKEQAVKWHLDLQVFNLGFPRFDLFKRNVTKFKKNGRVFTWIPRWSVDAEENDATSFFKYNENLMEYFRLHKELKLILRPHPLMFDHFVKLGIMTVEDVEIYKSNIDKENNIFLDDNIDYLETLVETDVLIADMSSINYEFYLMGKPMIYCGDPSEYNAETQKMMEYSYIVSNWVELKNKIELLANDVDPTFDDRARDIDDIFSNMPTNIGAAIIDKCLSLIR